MCMECRQYPCHPRCPNFVPKKASDYCDICSEGIYEDEEYIESLYGDKAHLDCVCVLPNRELLDWIRIDVMRTKE